MKFIEHAPWGHCRRFSLGDCNILVGLEPGGWHLSISHPSRYPNWDEIREARYALLPNRVTVAMILPPKEEYVNLHPNCFHLHELSKQEADSFKEKSV